MLVFVSGASYALSAKEKQILHTKEYFEYIFNRFKRLIVPTWIFLTLYFILFHLLNLCGVTDVYFTLKDYMGSYLLVSGIGFVWVIRVYFLMAVNNCADIIDCHQENEKTDILYVFDISSRTTEHFG